MRRALGGGIRARGLLAGALLASDCGSEPFSTRVVEAGKSFDLGDRTGSAVALSLAPGTGITQWTTAVPETRACIADQMPLLVVDDLIVAMGAAGTVGPGLAVGRPRWQLAAAGVAVAAGRSGGRTVIDARDADSYRRAAIDDGTGEVVCGSLTGGLGGGTGSPEGPDLSPATPPRLRGVAGAWPS